MGGAGFLSGGLLGPVKNLTLPVEAFLLVSSLIILWCLWSTFRGDGVNADAVDLPAGGGGGGV